MAGRSKAEVAVRGILEQRGQIRDRYMPLGLLTLSPDGDRILAECGGKYDSHDGVYIDSNVETVVTLRLIPDQVKPFECFLDWLESQIDARRHVETGMNWGNAIKLAWKKANADPLYGLHMYGGRQSGKTRLSLWMLFWTAISIPGARCIAVAPTGQRFQELITALLEHLPEEWCRYKISEEKFEFVNGSCIEIQSARVSDLKIGKAQITLVNEAQEIGQKQGQQDVRGNMTATSGLVVYAYNPPRRMIGYWLKKEFDSIKAGESENLESHFLNPENNPHADWDYLNAIGDPESNDYKREVLGRMDIQFEDTVFPMYEPEIHNIPVIPSHWRDVTRQISGLYYDYEAPWVGGLDFDRVTTGCSWIIGRWYMEDQDENLANAIFVIHNGHRERGYMETKFHDRLMAATDEVDQLAFETLSDVVWVSDSSGKRQNTYRDWDGPTSWERLQAKGWTLIFPWAGHTGNPRRMERYDQARDGLRSERVFLLSSATEVQKSLMNHPLNNSDTMEDKYKDEHAHINDAWGYCYYRKLSAEIEAATKKPATSSGPVLEAIPVL